MHVRSVTFTHAYLKARLKQVNCEPEDELDDATDCRLWQPFAEQPDSSVAAGRLQQGNRLE